MISNVQRNSDTKFSGNHLLITKIYKFKKEKIKQEREKEREIKFIKEKFNNQIKKIKK